MPGVLFLGRFALLHRKYEAFFLISLLLGPHHRHENAAQLAHKLFQRVVAVVCSLVACWGQLPPLS